MSDSLLSHGLYSPWNSPGQNTGVGSLSLLQRIFPAQGSEPGLPHCRWILYQLSHKGSPVLNRTLQNLWVLEQLSSLLLQLIICNNNLEEIRLSGKWMSVWDTYLTMEFELGDQILEIMSSPVQSLSCVWLFVTPWTAAHQSSLSIANSQSLPKIMSIESVIPSSHLILCHPLLLPPSIFPSIRVFSKESVLHMRWSNYWSFSFSISPSIEYSGLISFKRTGWISLQSKGLSRAFSYTTVQKHQFFGTQLSL